MEPGSTWGRSTRRAAAATLVALVLVAAPACSKDSSSDSSSSTTTLDVNVDPPNDPPTTTAPPAASTTEVDTEPAKPTTTEAVAGETFGGAIDGQGGAVDISFTKADGAIRNFTVRKLEIKCQPLAGGDATDRTIDVVLDRVPVGADGMVDYTDEDAEFAPQLSGSFAVDGRFIGGLYLSQQTSDAVCGGEFTFALGG